MIAQTRKEYNVDSTRFYLTGLSQGGHGTWAIAANHPDLFAAIAPVCGWGDEEIAKKLTKMPIWAFHGDADKSVPVESSVNMATLINAHKLRDVQDKNEYYSKNSPPPGAKVQEYERPIWFKARPKP